MIFASGKQQPRDRVLSSGRKGVHKNSDYLIEESLQAKELLCKRLGRRGEMWKWIAHTPGIDVTIAMIDGKVIGASLSVYLSDIKLVLTHATAVDKRFLRQRIGFRMRSAQVALYQNIPCLISLSSTTKVDGVSAAIWQRTVMKNLGYKRIIGLDFIKHMIKYIDEAKHWMNLGLMKTMNEEQVIPLMFDPVPACLPSFFEPPHYTRLCNALHLSSCAYPHPYFGLHRSFGQITVTDMTGHLLGVAAERWEYGESLSSRFQCHC